VSKSSWVFKYFGFDTGIVPDNTFILKTTYLDNIFLDDSFHQRMNGLKERNYKRWVIEALGDFVSLDRLVYEGFWRTEDFDYTKIDGTLCVGMDFGFTNDPSVIVASIAD
jgi:phage terminase large subunit